jgi:hypothetical protein
MARPKSTTPIRMPGVPVRFTPIERRYVESAKDKEYRDGLRGQGMAEMPVSAFLRAGAFERAQRLLGITLAEFEQRERQAGRK